MKRALLGLLVGCMTLGLASAAMAGENAQAGISLHITKPAAKTVCGEMPYNAGTSNPFTTFAKPCTATDIWNVWVVVCNASDSLGVAGAEFGIEYDAATGSGVDVTQWQLCADLQFQSDFWPEAGSGNLVTWEPDINCQTAALDVANPGPFPAYAIVGLFSVTTWGKDQMEVTTRPSSGRMKVADCLAQEDDITGALVARGGIAMFCGSPAKRKGYDYCQTGSLNDIEESTWGRIKAQYGN